jgi:cell division protein FtsB
VRRFLLGSAVVALLAFVAFGAGHAAWGMYGKFAEAATANEIAQHNLADLKSQEANVQSQVEALSSHVGQEAQLRKSYGVALPGEGEIQIVRQAPSSTPQATGSKGNFFTDILRALFVW